jgi:hypothetical protein
MTEAEIDQDYRDIIALDEAPKHINCTYYGKATVADRNGISEPMYGKEGRAWRCERWFVKEQINESPDQRGPRERCFFMPAGSVRADKNIFIVFQGDLQGDIQFS